MRIAFAIAVIGLASTSIAQQMPIPAFGSTFSGNTRGFSFQAPVSGIITGLSVPNENMASFQVVEVTGWGTAGPTAWPTQTTGTQLYYDNASVAGSILSVAIPLVAGEWYGILGACTGTVGDPISQNSYGTPAGIFASSMLGAPCTLTRFLTQSGISSNGGNQPCATEAGGSIGRVEVTVSGSGSSSVAWGYNSHGQINVSALPTGGVSDVEVTAGRWHTAARRDDGSVVAWGRNDEGQCNVSALPSGLSYVEVSAGGWHTVARRSDGSVVAWGRNTDGQCNVPTLPTGLSYVEVAAGGYHTVALRSDGSVVAWGQNYNGQTNVPGLPAGLVYQGVAAGLLHTLARRNDGSVKAWGQNADGQTSVPGTPTGLTNVEIAAGLFHSLARRSDGSVVAWGSNSDGQTDVPALPFGRTYSELSAGAAHTVARRSDGTVVAWGRNVEGQCNVPTGLAFVEVAAGGNHTVARATPTLASIEIVGVGCPAAQPLTLSSNTPQIGTSWILTASAIEQPSSLCVFWIGNLTIYPGLNLDFIGANGCFAYTNGNICACVETAAAGTSSHAIPVPNALAIVGASLTVQVSAPSIATVIGFSASNGVVGTVGH